MTKTRVSVQQQCPTCNVPMRNNGHVSYGDPFSKGKAVDVTFECPKCERLIIANLTGWIAEEYIKEYGAGDALQ